MGEMITTHATQIWTFLAGLVSGGLGGSLLTLRFGRQYRASSQGSIVDQSRSSAGGDIVGGDKRVGPERTR